MSEEISEQVLVDALKARGYSVEKRDDTAALGEKVATLETKLQSLTTQPATPEQQEQAVAEGLRSHLNAVLTPWYSLGGKDAA